jgi:hypothetical protein
MAAAMRTTAMRAARRTMSAMLSEHWIGVGRDQERKNKSK